MGVWNIPLAVSSTFKINVLQKNAQTGFIILRTVEYHEIEDVGSVSIGTNYGKNYYNSAASHWLKHIFGISIILIYMIGRHDKEFFVYV